LNLEILDLLCEELKIDEQSAFVLNEPFIWLKGIVRRLAWYLAMCEKVEVN